MLVQLIGVVVFFQGCGSNEVNSQAPNKDQILAGKADGIDWCKTFNFESGCDLCEEFDWYDDGKCDQDMIDAGYCKKSDVDCIDPCIGVICDTPPQEPICINEKKLQVYQVPGTCSLGECSYLMKDTYCDYEDQICKIDACVDPGGILQFPATGEALLRKGEILAGDNLVVEYDYHRLVDSYSPCIISNGPYGNSAWVIMGTMFDDDSSSIQYYDPVAGYSNSSYGERQIKNIISIPEESSKLSLWFFCRGNGGEFYDSNNSDNYNFEVIQP